MWARRSAPTAWASPQLCQLCQLCQPCQPRDLPCTWSGHDKHARPKWDTSVPTLRLRDTPASSSLRVPSRAPPESRAAAERLAASPAWQRIKAALSEDRAAVPAVSWLPSIP